MSTDRKELFKVRFERHYPKLCSIAYGYVADRDDSEDIVQETFIHIWDKGKDEMSEQDFVAYLTTAVKNRCISFLRRKKDNTVSIDDLPLADQHPADDFPPTAKRPARPKRYSRKPSPPCPPSARTSS